MIWMGEAFGVIFGPWQLPIVRLQARKTRSQTIFWCEQVPQIQTSQVIQKVHMLQPIQLEQPSAPPSCI